MKDRTPTGPLPHQETLTGIASSMRTMAQDQGRIMQAVDGCVQSVERLTEQVRSLGAQTFGGPGATGNDLDKRTTKTEDAVTELTAWKKTQTDGKKDRSNRWEAAAAGGSFVAILKLAEWLWTYWATKPPHS